MSQVAVSLQRPYARPKIGGSMPSLILRNVNVLCKVLALLLTFRHKVN